MAGTPIGCVEMFLTGSHTQEQAAQLAFKNIYDVVARHSSATIESLFYGNGGTGTNYYDVANPFLNGAFFVVKMPSNVNRDFDYWWLCQYKATAAITGNGLPALFANGSSVSIGFAVACVSGSTSSPWNGTTLANGSDSKATPVWLAATGSLLPLPASNRSGSVHGTSKQNMSALLFIGVAENRRFHFVMDDDNVAFVGSTTANGAVTSLLYFGPYENSLADTPKNNIVLRGISTTSEFFGFGGGDENTTGVIVNAPAGDDVGPCMASIDTFFRNSTYVQPSGSFNLKFMETPWNILGNETTEYTRHGFCGTFGPSFISHLWNVGNLDVKNDYSRAYFGSLTRASSKVGIPWDGFSVPGSGLSRTGSSF